MIGLTFGLYDFKNIKTTFQIEWGKKTNIISKLNSNGYYLIKDKLKKESCENIKKSLLDKDFHPFKSKRKIKGKDVIDKQIRIDNSSTFWISNHNLGSLKEEFQVQDLQM